MLSIIFASSKHSFNLKLLIWLKISSISIKSLDVLRAELDSYLASEYGIDRNNITKTEVYDEKFAQWQQSHQPFHWWIEFYGIMKRGGFDVIIGNPPYDGVFAR